MAEYLGCDGLLLAVLCGDWLSPLLVLLSFLSVAVFGEVSLLGWVLLVGSGVFLLVLLCLWVDVRLSLWVSRILIGVVFWSICFHHFCCRF